jgi:two-component system, OmpR family, alkaline phosphatase synthesis response regulator PhoP
MMKKVLIAEDERPIANALELKLKNLGYDVCVAHDGEEAWELLQHQAFDVSLIDLVMPKMDGFELLTHIRENHINTISIVTSNLSQQEDIARARSLGASDYIVKAEMPLQQIILRVQSNLQ